jgi:hypothetical protein
MVREASKQGLAFLLWGLCGCAGAAAPASAEQASDDPAGARGGATGGMSVAGAVGGLDSAAVQRVVQQVTPEVDRCVAAARKRLPYLGGHVGISLTVNRSGRTVEAFLPRTSLGDVDTEACILSAFTSKQWPRPVGGEVGKIEQSFDFSAGYDEPPRELSIDELGARMAADSEDGSSPLEAFVGQLDACRRGGGALAVTFYLDENGLVQAVGVGTADAAARAAVDCVTAIVKTTSFPASRDVYAKTTVTVP